MRDAWGSSSGGSSRWGTGVGAHLEAGEALAGDVGQPAEIIGQPGAGRRSDVVGFDLLLRLQEDGGFIPVDVLEAPGDEVQPVVRLAIERGAGGIDVVPRQRGG